MGVVGDQEGGEETPECLRTLGYYRVFPSLMPSRKLPWVRAETFRKRNDLMRFDLISYGIRCQHFKKITE